jgi:membrane-associated protein
MLALVNDFFDWLKEFSSDPTFYLIIFSIALLDAVLPVVPSETMVIIGGVAAGAGGAEDGKLFLPLVIAAGACGAFSGDNIAYLQWAHNQIEQRGGLLLITGRFIPGGRTILTISCGTTEQEHRWFARWIGVASVIWASYAATLGYFGGKAFEDNHTLAFIVAFLTAISITVIIEVIRYIRHNRPR